VPILVKIDQEMRRESAHRQIPWNEPSIRRVSSSRVWLVVGKKPNPWATHPVADLALEVTGGWWTRFAQIPFGLQLLNASYFELFYSWLACGTLTSSVHRECFQFRGCDATLSHCALQTVLVSLLLPTRTPEVMMKLPRQIHWHTDTLMQTGLIICPMLYAIAVGQIIKLLWDELNQVKSIA